MIDKLSRAIEGDTLRWTHWVIAGACALLPASVCGLNESLLYVRLDLHEDLNIGDFERSQLSAAALVGICLGSFFCAALLREGQAWVHTNQDTVSNGKPGSREKGVLK